MQDSEPCCFACGGIIANRQENFAHEQMPEWMSEFYVSKYCT